jgi:hypothetical protein
MASTQPQHIHFSHAALTIQDKEKQLWACHLMVHTGALHRCQDATSRLSIKFKVREGTSGVLQAFIIPSITPKACVSVSHKASH